MSRPDWCPQRVWDEAISFQYQEPGMCLANSQVEPTARAILAAEQRGAEVEREACALLADAQAAEPDPDEQDPYDEYEIGCRGTARRLARTALEGKP